MAANFPTSAPGLTTNYNDNTDDVMAANQNQPNLEINAVAAKVGINSDTTVTSHDYKIAKLYEPPRGYLINGKIVPSVAANNLTVAIKGLDGNDPSATNVVTVRIGDTVRTITSALSVTKNAGTNWFSSGTVYPTQERDYFVYLGYNATDGVVVGFSPYPSGNEYDSFSATSTVATYCAISTITNAAAGDDYELIGRFAATLSAGAGYTWSVPTFTNKNLVQRPIFDVRPTTPSMPQCNNRLCSTVIESTKNLADATGDTAYTGVGFRPSSIVAIAGVTSSYPMAIGFSDAATTVRSVGQYGANTFFSGAYLLALASSGGNQNVATVKSYDTDGFTLTWTKSGSPTGTAGIFFLCFR